MPDINEHADSLGIYLTGAGSSGGSQTDPNAALGNYRSSSKVTEQGASVSSPISNVTVDFVAAANGTGAGTLDAPTSGTLTWTPPGGSVGAAVAIANGETKVLEGANADQYIIVTRTSASSLTGTATVTLTNPMNNLFGFDNVSSAEAAAGDSEYRCVAFKNNHASVSLSTFKAWIGTLGTQRTSDSAQLGASGSGTITTTGSLADWPSSGYAHIKTSGGTTREIVYYSSRTTNSLTVPSAGRGLLGTSAAAGASDDTIDAVPGIRIAKEAPTGSSTAGNAQTIANEGTAPTGVTWSTACTEAAAVSIGTLGVGEIYFLWIHRQTPAGAVAKAVVLQDIETKFDAA